MQHEGRLEVVVEGDRARAVAWKSDGGRLALEVNQDALDDVGVLDDARVPHRLSEDVRVDAAALAHLEECLLADAACDDVGVERVDEGVGLGVVAEEGLFGAGRRPSGNRRGPRSLSRAAPARSAGSL